MAKIRKLLRNKGGTMTVAEVLAKVITNFDLCPEGEDPNGCSAKCEECWVNWATKQVSA